MLQGTIATDGSGKIDGVQYARVYFSRDEHHRQQLRHFHYQYHRHDPHRRHSAPW